MYVDDLTSGTNSTDEIEQRKKGIKENLKKDLLLALMMLLRH